MSIVGSATRKEGRPASGDYAKDSHTYIITWLVITDDYDDGPQVVSGASGLGTVSQTTYAVGNDTDITAVLSKQSFRRHSKEPLWWWVTETYGPFPGLEEEENKPDSGGNNTTNPDDWFPEFRRLPHSYQAEAASGWNLEAWHPDAGGGNFARAINTEGPITNVIGEPIDPLPLMSRQRASLEITSWYLFLDADTTFLNTEGQINDRDITFSYLRPWTGVEYRQNCDKHTLRVGGYDVSLKRTSGGSEYLEVRAKFDYDPLTWNVDVPNESLLERANAGDKNNDDDSTISAGDLSANRPNVQPQRAEPKADDNKLPLPRPIDLNGVASDDPVNLGYRLDTEADFRSTIGSGTGILAGMIQNR